MKSNGKKWTKLTFTINNNVQGNLHVSLHHAMICFGSPQRGVYSSYLLSTTLRTSGVQVPWRGATMKNTMRWIIGWGLLFAGFLIAGSLRCALAEGTAAIGPASCTPGTSGCGWKEGELRRMGRSAGAWIRGTCLKPTTIRSTHLMVVSRSAFPARAATRYGLSAAQVIAYLPAIGPIRPLDADVMDPTASLIDPASTSSGAFGGIVLALRLNIDLSDAGVLRSNTGLRFGDLRLCNYTKLPTLDGMTVHNISALANTLLGGGSNGYTIDDVAEVAGQLGEAFLNGVPNPFAQDHVVNGPCP